MYPVVMETREVFEVEAAFNQALLGPANPKGQQTRQAPGKLEELF